MGGFRTLFNMTKKEYIVLDGKDQVVMAYKMLLKTRWDLSDEVLEETDRTYENYGKVKVDDTWVRFGENDKTYGWKARGEMTDELFEKIETEESEESEDSYESE